MSSIAWHDIATYDRTIKRERAADVMRNARVRWSETPSPLEALVRPEWQMDAACRGVGADKSHPPPSRRDQANGGRDALAFIATYCDVCSVKAQCLAYALEHETIPIGVWGGMTATARARFVRGQSLGKQRTSGIVCGTAAGYQRHRRAGEMACRACMDANARRAELRKQAKREREAQ